MKRFYLTFAIAVAMQCCDVVTTAGLNSSILMGHVLYITPTSSIHCHTKPCLTLSQFAQNYSYYKWLTPRATLIFLSGNHTLNTTVSLTDVENLSMIPDVSDNNTKNIFCISGVHFEFVGITSVTVKGLRFIGCGNNTLFSVKNFTIEDSVFRGVNGSGTALVINETNLTIANCYFFSNRVGTCMRIFDAEIQSNVSVRAGGVIFAAYSTVTIIKSRFEDNSAELGGAIFSHRNCALVIINSTFSNNKAITAARFANQCLQSAKVDDLTVLKFQRVLSSGGQRHKNYSNGGVLASGHTSLRVQFSTFINNTSEYDAGVLSIQDKSIAVIENSEFLNNHAKHIGGVHYVYLANVTIERSTHLDNTAGEEGGVMKIYTTSIVNVRNCTFKRNSAKFGGVLSTDENCQLVDVYGKYINNSAMTAGVVSAVRTKLTCSGTLFALNRANLNGGAVYIVQSKDVLFSGFCELTNNIAGSTGGAVFAVESNLYIYNYATLSVIHNAAGASGGGLYLYRSTLNLIDKGLVSVSSNVAVSYGGGIHADNSLVVCTQFLRQAGSVWPFQSLLIISDNSADKGGGVCLESAAQLRVQMVADDTYLSDKALNTSVLFQSNTAHYGSAIYVVDETYFGLCARGPESGDIVAECFIQVFCQSMLCLQDRSRGSHAIKFITDRTDFQPSQSVIFGGLLDRCLPDPRAEVFAYSYMGDKIDGMTYLKLISNLNDTRVITSRPVRVCFCTPDNRPDCSYELPVVYIEKGQNFSVSLVAVDQVNRTLPSVMIYGSLNHLRSSLGEGEMTQVTGNACTNLTYSIFSPHSFETLILYAEGPCRNVSWSQKIVNVSFKPCRCPIGFQPQPKKDRCVCICDQKLSRYFTQSNCVYQTETLTRDGNFWIDFVNATHSNDSKSGFLIYAHCPFGYCLPQYPNVKINLNIDNGADAQCADNRSGLLCGSCRPGLSLSLGSSRCISCTGGWIKGVLPIVIASIVAGLILVILLMVLNLTVAVGTLNGLIFYANILGAIKSSFFSELSPSTTFLSVLVSWLNFEAGFDVCFFKGMDTYWKTWLQLAFPTYVILLVIVTIIVSEYSMKFSRLMAKFNPVATLATLLLLSYTMFLRTTIAALSFATLKYPDGSHKIKWLPDASMDYLQGKHIILFVMALIIIIFSTAYTCLLFFWQWIIQHQDKAIFKWMRFQKLHHFIEPYHAPYVVKYRFWTGLLQFARIVLYLAFALNVSGDPKINLLAVILTLTVLLLIKGTTGRVYKNPFVDNLEMICFANVAVLSVIKFKLEGGKIADAAAYVSGAIVILVMIVVISYHVTKHVALIRKCHKGCRYGVSSQWSTREEGSGQCVPNISGPQEENGKSEMTYSVVEIAPSPCRNRQCKLKRDTVDESLNGDQMSRFPPHGNEGCYDSGHDDDNSPTDSSIPLLHDC